jgi:hypothetical protein
MALAALVALYLMSALVLALTVKPQGRRASRAAAWCLSLLPLAFTAEAFLPGRTLAPTRILAYVAPWADPDIVAEVERRGSASNPLLLDPASQFIPWDRAAREDLLFNPAQGAGAALLGNGQSALLFPTEAVARLLRPFRAVGYRQAGRLLVAVWGMFLLMRLLGYGELGATTAAAVFVGSGFVQLWRLHPHSNVAAAAPWILAASVALLRRPGARSAIVLGIAGAMGVFGGHPETLLHVLLFASVAAPLLAARASPSRARGRWRATLGWGAAAALVAFLFAAPVLLPLIENLRDSVEWLEFRGERRDQLETTLEQSLLRLRPAGAVMALGDPRRSTWAGPENLAELGGAALGAPALFLALLAFAREPRRWGPLLLLGLLGILVSAHVPIVSAPFAKIPLLQDSLLKRLGLWWVLAGSVLAGAGAEGLSARTFRARLTAALAAVLPVVALVSLVLAGAPRAEQLRIAAVEHAPLLLVLLAVLVAGGMAPRAHENETAGSAASRLRSSPIGLVWGFTILAALVLPRGVLFARWIPAVPSAGFYPLTSSIEAVQSRLAELPPHGYRVAGTGGALAPNSAAFYGLEDIRAYDPLTFGAYARFLSSLGEVPHAGWVNILVPTGPILDYLGVRFVFDDVKSPRLPENSVAYLGRDAVVWERPTALPRAFFPQEVQVELDAIAAADEARQVADFGVAAIVGEGCSAGESGADSRVLELAVGLGEVLAVTRSPVEAVLVTSQPAIPGWRLFIDGEAAPERRCRVNGAFLGALAPSGEHRLEFRYRPWSWLAGVGLAGSGIVLAIVLLSASTDQGGKSGIWGPISGRRKEVADSSSVRPVSPARSRETRNSVSI